MQMSNEKKKEILLKNFEIIKDNYNDNVESLGLIVQKMIAIDEDTAIEIWSFLLTKYRARIQERGSYDLTGGIIYQIGKRRIGEIVKKSSLVKDGLFSQSYDVWAQATVAADFIVKNELLFADELLNLLYLNPYKKQTWYEVMENAMPRRDSEITSDAYELLEMWCDKVKNIEERAKLSVKMIDFID